MDKIHESSKNDRNVDVQKVAIIGCGFVGSSTAFALMESGMFSEIVLIDADYNKADYS